MTIGTRIRKSREAIITNDGKSISQSAFANLCGWKDAQTRMANYEKDIRRPSIKDIEVIANAANVDPAYIAFNQKNGPSDIKQTELQKKYIQLNASWQKKVDDLIQAGLDSQQPKRNLTLYQRGLERVLLALSDKSATPDKVMHYAQVIYQEALANDYADNPSNVVEFNQFADKTIKRLTA